MGILHLKWITESDHDLSDLRRRFSNDYPDVKVGSVRPDRGTAYRYSDYYIQIAPNDFPPQVHFEYWADGSQGFLDLHLEPNRDNQEELKVFRQIGINLMHILSEYDDIEYGERWKLPFGYFRIKGIRNVDQLMRQFSYLYGLVNGKLQEIYESKKVIAPLKVDYEKKEMTHRQLRDGDEAVVLKIMNLSEVMDLNLRLPDYQREYCWEDKNISDLWKNLNKINDGKPFHLGTLILHDNNGYYDIIDGQQRLTTLTIMLLALGYSGYLPLLNESYESTDAQEHIENCKWLVQKLVSKGNLSNGKVSLFAKNISFAVLVVNEDNLDLAYTFFSNQNSKGVPLSDFDLLKAHHLRYVVTDGQAEHMAIKWNNLNLLPPVYKEKNALFRTLGTHLYRLRRWMRKNESREGEEHYIQKEYETASTMPDIPPFGEKFDFYEKIQGGTHFFVYAETFIHRYLEFLKNPIIQSLQKNVAWGSYEIYSDSIETVLFAYYLKFGSQYLGEALYYIAQLFALHRYNSGRVAGDGTGVRSFANGKELVLMIDQATSPTFFLAEAMNAFDSLSQKEEYEVTCGIDLPETKGVKWGLYKALRALFNEILPEITDSLTRKKIIEEYGK